MIEEKFIEIRDAGTKIPALAYKIRPLTDLERALMRSAGYGEEDEQFATYVFLTKLDGLETQHDPFAWSSGARTMKYAHLALTGNLYHAIKNPDVADNEAIGRRCDEVTFARLRSGDVLDVEWVLGLTTEKKIAEALACPACHGRRVILSEIGQKDASHVCPFCLGTGRRPPPTILEQADTPLHRKKKGKK